MLGNGSSSSPTFYSCLARNLTVIWIVLGLTPLALFWGHYETRLIIFTNVVYWVGWFFWLSGCTRDPRMEILSSFARTSTACIAASGTVLLLQGVAWAFSAAAMLVMLITAIACLFGLWALSRTSRDLTRNISRLLLMLSSILVTAFAGEVVLSFPTVCARTMSPAFVTAYRDQWCRENYDRIWEKNIHSFRSFHLENPKAMGSHRMVTLGDSFTWGDKIAATKDIWPYVLEKTCCQKDIPVEVINLARPGFTTVNEEEMLERFGWSCEPDVIILQYFLNDPLPSGPNFQCKGEDWMKAPTWHLLPFMHRTLDQKSYFYSLANQKFSKLQRNLFHLQDMDYSDLFSDHFAGWQDGCMAIQRMADSTRKRKVPMLLVIFPSFMGKIDDSSYPYLMLHEKIKSTAAANRLPVIDLRPQFAKIQPNGPSWWALSVDTHPGVRAHRLAGEIIAEELVKLGFITPPIRPGR